MVVKYDVLGIGNAIMDVIAPVSDGFLTENEIAKGGMTLIDQPRALDIHKSLSAIAKPQEVAGGSAANTLVGIAQLGVRAAYIGKVANDALGDRFSGGMNAAPFKSGRDGSMFNRGHAGRRKVHEHISGRIGEIQPAGYY